MEANTHLSRRLCMPGDAAAGWLEGGRGGTTVTAAGTNATTTTTRWRLRRKSEGDVEDDSGV